MAAHFPAIITLLALLLLLTTVLIVGLSRRKYGVIAPATTGNDDFERIFRVQMNTQENLVIFLPALWLFSHYVSAFWAGLMGAVWMLGRIDYTICYIRVASKRGRGFIISLLAFIVLWVGAAIGIGIHMISVL